MASKRQEERNRRDRERTERRHQVATFFNQGNTNVAEISVKLGVPEKTIKKDLAVIRAALSPKTIAALEYRRNKSLAALNLIKAEAWRIKEAGARIKSKQRSLYVQLKALGLALGAEQEAAKVQGLTTDKIVTPPAKKGTKLMEDIRTLKARGDGDDGHREEKEVKDARPGTELGS